jgi:hypothetical protein
VPGEFGFGLVNCRGYWSGRSQHFTFYFYEIFFPLFLSFFNNLDFYCFCISYSFVIDYSAAALLTKKFVFLV